jgi:hypothetical protein
VLLEFLGRAENLDPKPHGLCMFYLGMFLKNLKSYQHFKMEFHK